MGIDPIKSLLIDVEEFWTNMKIGEEVTSRDIFRCVSSDKSFDIHKLNAIGAFLNRKVKYSQAETLGEKVSDPRYKKISEISSRPKNKRFCDVINSQFSIEEGLNSTEYSLRYKNMHPRDPITKNYINKLLHALESHGCLLKLKRGTYAKVRDIAEVEMTSVTRFIKKKAEIPVERTVIRTLPVRLPQVDGYATVKSDTLEIYIKEVKTLKLIIRAQQRELEEKDRFIKGLPMYDLPAIDTEEYADLKQKYGII